jgi:hypothetical protein
LFAREHFVCELFPARREKRQMPGPAQERQIFYVRGEWDYFRASATLLKG